MRLRIRASGDGLMSAGETNSGTETGNRTFARPVAASLALRRVVVGALATVVCVTASLLRNRYAIAPSTIKSTAAIAMRLMCLRCIAFQIIHETVDSRLSGRTRVAYHLRYSNWKAFHESPASRDCWSIEGNRIPAAQCQG